MFRFFNMLLQNLTNIGVNITEVSLREKFTEIKFTDANGKKYSVWVNEETGEKESV